MQLILVVGKVDMINQICQMLSFCWKLLSAYFAEKMITKYSSNCAKHACIRNTNLCFFSVCMQVNLVNILTYVPILSYKMASISHNCNRHAVRYKRPVATWSPLGVVSLVHCLHCDAIQGHWYLQTNKLIIVLMLRIIFCTFLLRTWLVHSLCDVPSFSKDY